MELAEAPLVVSLIGLAAYMVLGGADFGAGLWFLLSGPGQDREHLREHTFRAMGPVWEVNHVWLIFGAGGLLDGAYPDPLRVDRLDASGAAFHRGRGQHHARNRVRAAEPQLLLKGDNAIGLVFSLSSVLTPFALGTAIGGTASGRDPVGTLRETSSRAGSTQPRS